MKIQTIPASVLLPATVDWLLFFGTPEEIDLANLIYNSLNGTLVHLGETEVLERLSTKDICEILKSIAETAGGKKVTADTAKFIRNGKYKTGGIWRVHMANLFDVQYTVGRQRYLWNKVQHLSRPIKQ